MTDIDQLLVELDKIIAYPIQMEKIRCGIKGLAFFPGGRGLYNDDDQTILNKEIMVLGQDFDTLDKYRKAEEKGKEDLDKNKTWKNLSTLLKAANVDLKNCFFTNALMGARLTPEASGKSPGFEDKNFIQACQKFFLLQLQLQKPKAVIVMGLRVAEFLSPLSENLKSWKKIKGYKEIDMDPNEIVKMNVTFQFDNMKTNLILLMHPSARAYNLDVRQYKGKAGHEAQIEMLKDVLA